MAAVSPTIETTADAARALRVPAEVIDTPAPRRS